MLGHFQRTRRKVQRRVTPYRAVLGDTSGNPKAGNGLYWVRPYDGANANNIATNGVPYRVRAGSALIQPRGGRVVWVGPGLDGRLTVLGFDHDDLVAAGMDPTAVQPNDPYRQWIRLKNIQNFRALPLATGNTPSMKVQVRQLFYYTETGDLVRWNGTNEDTHIDLTAYVPADGFQCYVVLWLRTYNPNGLNPIQVTYSDHVDSIDYVLGFNELQQCADAADPDTIPIQAFRLADAQTTLKMNDSTDVDLRQFFNMPQVWGFPNTVGRAYRIHEGFSVLAPSSITIEDGGLIQIQDNALLRILGDDDEEGGTGGGGGIDQLTGDGTAGPGSGSQALTLATVNSNVGSFTNASITVNGKGLVTAASSGTAPLTSFSETLNYLSAATVAGAVTLSSPPTLLPAYVVATHPTNPSVAELRALDPAHIPFLDAAKITSGTFAIARGGTGQSTKAAAYDALSPTTTEGDIEYRNATTNTRLPIGTANQQLRVNSGATAPEWFTPATPVTSVGGTAPIASSGGATPTISLNDTAVTPGSYTYGAFTVDQKGRLTSASSGLAPNIIAILRDEKTSGTNGGTSVTTTWNARDLNTELYDPGGIVSISSNQFTPIAGDYEILVSTPFFGGSAAASTGRCRLYNVTGAAVVEEGMSAYAVVNGYGISVLNCKFTANGTDAYRIDTYTSVGKATNGLGPQVGDGSPEVYTCIMLRKVG